MFNMMTAQVNHTNPINNYISFANESTHGMLIAHRILEGLNQEVNAFVDLQSNQLNFYGNKDLPKDLFDDPEHWFYPISPNNWYKIIESTAWQHPYRNDLDQAVRTMHSVSKEINQMRFSMESFIKTNDLRQASSQVQIFEQLHKCASLYDRYYESNNQLHSLTNRLIEEENNQSSRKSNYVNLQNALKKAMEIVRYGFNNELHSIIAAIQKENNILQKETARNNSLRDMQAAVKDAINILNNYQSGINIPEKYNLYGHSYYYHNVELASILNRYGKGFASNANKILFNENPNQLLLLEEPHYFMVVMPKKEISLASTQKTIDVLPAKLEQREVVISQTKIQVTDKKILLEIFDHRQEDGDIISLNFNGRWILKERQLTKVPLKLVIELNDSGENYLLLHADNLGTIPPNTIAIRYYLEGMRKTVVLNSDLDQSEMIRIQRMEEGKN